MQRSVIWRSFVAKCISLRNPWAVVVSRKSFRHLTDLIQGLGTIPQEAFLIERAMISFDKPILLGVMRIADEYGYSESMTKAHKGSREVAALRSSDPTGVTVQGNGSR